MSRTEKIKEFLKEHQNKIIMTVGFILTTAISFALGRLSVTENSDPIQINDPDMDLVSTGSQSIPSLKSEGSFVGNINDNKFFPINSAEANIIPEDEKIWFDSQEDAIEQDYIQGTATTINTPDNTDTDEETSNTAGKYVGSKNSDKYHLPDSGSAKRIKDENKVWFQSKEEAEAEGYEPGSSVLKEEN